MLETIYYIGQTISVVAIIVSLIFVGVQVRQNTKATQAASHGEVSRAMIEVNRMYAESNETTDIFMRGRDDRQALSSNEQWRFDHMMLAYFHVCETMYVQASLGAGDSGIVIAEQDTIKMAMSSAGCREWWDGNIMGFSKEFRAYVDGLAVGVAIVSSQDVEGNKTGEQA